MGYKRDTLTDKEMLYIQTMLSNGYSNDYIRSKIGFSCARWVRARKRYPYLDILIKSSFKKHIGFVPRCE